MFWNILFLFLGIVLGFLIFQFRSFYLISKNTDSILNTFSGSFSELLNSIDRGDDDGSRNN